MKNGEKFKMYEMLTTKELIGEFISNKYPKDVLNRQHWCLIEKSCFLFREALNWTTYRIRPNYFESARGVVDNMSQVSHHFVPIRINI